MIHYLKPGVAPRMRPLTARPIDVSAALAELDQQPSLWNQHRLRTQGYSPHKGIDDIWVRYQGWTELTRRKNNRANQEHRSEWYPAYAKLPALRPLIFGLFPIVAGEELGGVLITRIPAGCQVAPHRDSGWHAKFFNRKVLLCLRADQQQSFCFEGETMLAETGEAFEFNNADKHWVVNDSKRERISMIVCIRSAEGQPMASAAA